MSANVRQLLANWQTGELVDGIVMIWGADAAADD